jgi:folate-binding protein YgfZ
MTGYQALRDHCAWIDLSSRGKIRATGEDRVRFLHAMCTNHVQQLTPGAGCYAFFLNAQGRILADANIYCFEDHFLLDTEPETRRTIIEHLEKYIIADDVTLEDVTESLPSISLEGPRSAEIMASLGAPLPATPLAWVPWERRGVAANGVTGSAAFSIFYPPDEGESVRDALAQAGVVEAAADDVRRVQMEHGRARYGVDFSDAHIPHETQLLHAVHFNKGCYLGQEIVERVRSRGLVHRLLVRIAIEGTEPPPAGAEVTVEGGAVGRISSAAFSPSAGRVLAFAFLRREVVDSPQPLRVGDASAELIAAKPWAPA